MATAPFAILILNRSLDAWLRLCVYCAVQLYILTNLIFRTDVHFMWLINEM